MRLLSLKRVFVSAAALAVGLTLSGPAAGQSVDATNTDPDKTAQGDVSVTIYNNNLALVQDIRQLNIPNGISRQEFPDVSAQIRAETVSFAADSTSIIEQNFDYDLLTPAKLMEKAVGETITIIRTNVATGNEVRQRAKVLSVNNGVVLEINGNIEVMRDDGLPVRAIFDRIPEGLRARPTLSITMNAAQGGTRAASLRYLTPGLGWQSDYVALYNERDDTIDMQGWVTLTNNSGTTYTKADTLLVAGNVSGTRALGGFGGRGGTMTEVGTETAQREQLGDFYLYPIDGRTTIADKQTKQVSFLDVQGVKAAKTYEFAIGWLNSFDQPRSASTAINFSTSRDGGLGDALPAGTVRFYQRDARGTPQFIGENGIGHTPMGSTLSLKTGDAFDVKIKTETVERKRISSNEWEKSARWRVTDSSGNTTTYTQERPKDFYRSTMRYTITNARNQPVTVDLRQFGLQRSWWGDDTRVTSETLKNGDTLKGVQDNADTRLWKVPVPANGTSVLTVVYETRY